jgi:hypothetical protein
LKAGFLGPGGAGAGFCGAGGDGCAPPDAAAAAVSGVPVRIWTTCLKEVVSAWTNVVGKGLDGSADACGSGTGSGIAIGTGEGGAGRSRAVVAVPASMRKMSPLAGLAWLASLGSEEDRVRERERQGVLWAFRGVEFLELWDLEFQLRLGVMR